MKLALEEWNKAVADTESLKAQIDTNLKLATKLTEELAAYQRMKKRLRVASYVELGVGVPCLVLGLLPIWTDGQQNIKNLLLGIGGTATAAGCATFAFTITF